MRELSRVQLSAMYASSARLARVIAEGIEDFDPLIGVNVLVAISGALDDGRCFEPPPSRPGSSLEMSLDEIGEELGVSRERVRQIEQGAIRKIRHAIDNVRLKGFSSDDGYQAAKSLGAWGR